MKYLILLVITMATIARAKEPNAPCLRLQDIKTQKLRQGDESLVRLTFETNCYVKLNATDSSPILEIQSMPGIQTTVTNISQRESEHEISVTLALKASTDMALGNQKLHGLVHYQAIVSGSHSDKTFSFDLPVQVLEPRSMDALEDKHPVWNKVLIVGMAVAVIVFFPVFLVLYMVGNGPC
jgi:hypothetical protein